MTFEDKTTEERLLSTLRFVSPQLNFQELEAGFGDSALKILPINRAEFVAWGLQSSLEIPKIDEHISFWSIFLENRASRYETVHKGEAQLLCSFFGDREGSQLTLSSESIGALHRFGLKLIVYFYPDIDCIQQNAEDSDTTD